MNLKLARSPRLAFFGALLIVAAMAVSNAAIEKAFGRQPQSLSWGPTLFRTLLSFHGAFLLAASAFPKTSRLPGPIKWPNRQSWAILGVLTIAGTALRIPGLDSCLWLDEVLTMARYARPPLAWIFTSFPDQNQHMLYSILAHVSMAAFGEHAWALRLPSVILGLISIWSLYFLGRRVIGNTEALIAAALMTVSYHHIWFSQNARGYMGLLLFTNLATWLWLEAMDRDTWPTWIAYAVSVALGLWIHMTMLFVLASHALIFLGVWMKSNREPAKLARAAVAFALCGTITLQIYALSLPEFLRTAAGEVSPPSEWTNPLWVVTETLRSLRIGFAGSFVVLCGGLLVAAGWLDILRREQRAAWAMVLPAVMGGASMLALGHNLWPRFFFFAMGFGLLIVVHGAVLLPRLLSRLLDHRKAWKEWPLRLGYALAGLIIVASITTIPRCYALPKQDFTGARDFVERQRGPGDGVIVVGLAAHAYSEYYAPRWPVAETVQEMAALRQNRERTYVVYTLPIELQAAHPDLWKTVQSDFETVKVFPGTLGGGEVYVCRNRSQEIPVALRSN